MSRAARGFRATDAAAAKWLKEKHAGARWMRGAEGLEEGALNGAVHAVLGDVEVVKRHQCMGWHSYATAIHLLCKLQRPHLAQRLWREGDVTLKEPAPIAVYTALLGVHLRRGRLVDALGVWRCMREAPGVSWATDRRVYTLLMRGFSKAGLPHDPIERVFRLACLHVTPDGPMVTAYIMTHTTHAAALRVAHEFCSTVPERERLRALLCVCKTEGNAAAAKATFEQIIPACSVSWSHYLQAHSDPDALREILGRMQAAGVPPLPGCYVHCIAHARAVEEAEGVYLAAQAAGRMNITTHIALLRLYIARGRLKAARALVARVPVLEHTAYGKEALPALAEGAHTGAAGA